MVTRRGTRSTLLALAVLLGAAAAAECGTPVADVDVILEKVTGCVIVDPQGGDGIDEVCVSLPKGATPTGIGQVTPADAAWRLDASSKRRVCARRDTPIGPQPVIFDLAEPPRSGKYDVTIRGSGEVLFRRRGIRSRDLPPAQTLRDVSSALTLPNVVNAGELVMASAVPGALPPGGRWSLSGGIRGVVLAPEPLESAPEAGGDSEVGHATSGARGSLTGTVLDRQDLASVASAIEDAERMVLYVPRGFGASGKGDSGNPGVLGDPIPEVDITEDPGGGGGSGGSGGSSGGSGSDDPCVILPGRQVDQDLLSIWDLLCPGIEKPEGELVRKGREQRDKTAKKELAAADAQAPDVVVVPVRVTYTNRYGQRLVDGEVDVTALLAQEPEDAKAAATDGERGPAIVSGTEMAFAGQPACVCGSFPRPCHWQALRLDGEALAPRAASGRLVTFDLPTDSPPGTRVVSGQPEAGFSETDRWPVTVLALEGALDRQQLFRGGSTTMRLNIVGTEEPIQVRLRNSTPQVISLEGGDQHVATSTGGTPNVIDREVRAVKRGDFNIEWELLIGPCPCAEQLDAHQLSKGVIRKID